MWIRTDTAFFNLGQCSSIEIASKPGTEKKTVYMLVATTPTATYTITEIEAEGSEAESALSKLNSALDNVLLSLTKREACHTFSIKPLELQPSESLAHKPHILTYLANRQAGE